MAEKIRCRITDRSTGDRGMGEFYAAPGCVPRVGDHLVFVSPYHKPGTVPVSWQVAAVSWHIGTVRDFVLGDCDLICQPAPGPYWAGGESWWPKDEEEGA